MNRRTFEEMVSYFNQTVADMDIDRKYKMELLGMITAILQRHDEDMKHAPTIEERKKGKWTKGSDMPLMKHRNGKPKKFWPSLKYCSNCGHEAFDDSDWGEQLFDFCPYCGADMR